MDGRVEASSAVMSSLIWILISISSPLVVEDVGGESTSMQQVQQVPNCLGYYG
jgi:hypothetical protein